MEKIVCGLTDLKDIGRTLRPGIPQNNIVQSKQSEAIGDQKPVQTLPNQYLLSKRKSSLPFSNRKTSNKRTSVPQDNPVCDPPNEPNQIRKPWAKSPCIQDDPKKFALLEGKDKLG